MAKGKIALQIRLDETVYELVKGIAEEEMRSLNAQMEYFIKMGAEQHLLGRKRYFDALKEEDSQE